MHVKRQKTPKEWPIPRKGTKYLVRPSDHNTQGVPVLVLLRDMMKIAKNRKEVKKIIKSEQVYINGKIVRAEEKCFVPFDTLKVGDKNYELVLSDKKKFVLQEKKDKLHISKIIGRKSLKDGKFQINLMYGKNIISKEKVNVGDSLIIEDKKIVKTLRPEKGREALILAGKHKGRKEKIVEIEDKHKMVRLSGDVTVPIKNIIIVG